MTAPNTCHGPGCSAPVSSPGSWCPSCLVWLERERHAFAAEREAERERQLKAWIGDYYAARGVRRGG